jgi:hypothetical protein
MLLRRYVFGGRLPADRTTSVQYMDGPRQPTHAWVGYRAYISKDGLQQVLERFHIM